MDKFNHVLCGLLILLCCALTNATTTPSTSTTEQNRHTTTGILTGNISNSLPNNSVQNISTTTAPNSYSETSTSSNSQSNSTITSPTVQTQITTVQINSSITDTTPTSLATQPASKPATTSVSNTRLTTLSSSAVTAHGNESTSGTAATKLTTEKAPGNKTNNEPTAGASMKLPEKSMTILFSVILGVIVLLVLGQIVYKVSRNKHRSVQYSHRPLYNEDTGEHFVVPDDTLAISGGLYDGPQIYNPTVAALNDEDQLTFSYTPTQLRLEFLHEEQGTDQDYDATSFETFKTSDTSHD